MEPPSATASSPEPTVSESSINVHIESSNARQESSLQVPAALQQILPNSAFQRLVSTIRSGQNVLNSASPVATSSRTLPNNPAADNRRRSHIIDSGSISSSSDIESGFSTESRATDAPAHEQTPEEIAAAAAEARQQLQTAIDLQNALKSLVKYIGSPPFEPVATAFD
jgi:hypothetical protein